MICYRFSEDGFVPKIQYYHQEGFQILKETLEDDSFKMNPYQREAYLKFLESEKKKLDNLCVSDFDSGFFAFAGKPSEEYARLMLNHLDKEDKAKRKWFTKDFDDQTVVYDDESSVPEKYTLKDFVEHFGLGKPFFMPNPVRFGLYCC